MVKRLLLLRATRLRGLEYCQRLIVASHRRMVLCLQGIRRDKRRVPTNQRFHRVDYLIVTLAIGNQVCLVKRFFKKLFSIIFHEIFFLYIKES